MQKEDLIDLVRRYFDGVDGEDFATISDVFTADCVFSVETHGVRLERRDEIEAMFARLWANHKSVRHEDFTFVAAPADNRIAAQFTVINTHHDGRVTRKSNCNFFELRGGRFKSVAVYMAGENTLDID